MYRIPADLDLSEIVGADLNQICLGRHDAQFVFSSGTKIAVQSRITVLEDKVLLATWNEMDNWDTVCFQRILQAMVHGYAVINDKTLEILFPGRLKLRLHDDSDQYESMQIYCKGDANAPIVI